MKRSGLVVTIDSVRSGLNPSQPEGSKSVLKPSKVSVSVVPAPQTQGTSAAKSVNAPSGAALPNTLVDGSPSAAESARPRALSGTGEVAVRGKVAKVVGRVSMDMITVDLAPVPTAEVGSQVTLWGDGLPVDEVAAAAGTIGYELLCALTPRVQRRVRN